MPLKMARRFSGTVQGHRDQLYRFCGVGITSFARYEKRRGSKVAIDGPAETTMGSAFFERGFLVGGLSFDVVGKSKSNI